MSFHFLKVWHLYSECQSYFGIPGNRLWAQISGLVEGPQCVFRFPASSSHIWYWFCSLCSANHRSQKGEIHFQWRILHWGGEYSFNKIYTHNQYSKGWEKTAKGNFKMFKDKNKLSKIAIRVNLSETSVLGFSSLLFPSYRTVTRCWGGLFFSRIPTAHCLGKRMWGT